MECQHGEVETMEWTEYSATLVLVGIVDGAGYPMKDGSFDSWLDSENRLPAVAYLTEVGTEVVTEVLTSFGNAKLLLA